MKATFINLILIDKVLIDLLSINTAFRDNLFTKYKIRELYRTICAIIPPFRKDTIFMAGTKSEQSRFLGDLPMTGQITEKERIRYISHLMFFIGCALLSFGVWALSGFASSGGQSGPFPI